MSTSTATTTPISVLLDYKNLAIEECNRLHKVWWKEYMKDKDSEDTKAAYLASSQLRAQVIAKYGAANPEHLDCKTCLEYSVFGGPSHDASQRCESGKRSHCSCDCCF